MDGPSSVALLPPMNPSLSASPSPCAHLVSAEGCAPQGPTSKRKAGVHPPGSCPVSPPSASRPMWPAVQSGSGCLHTLFRDCLHEAKFLLPHLSGSKRESRGPSRNLESLGDGREADCTGKARWQPEPEWEGHASTLQAPRVPTSEADALLTSGPAASCLLTQTPSTRRLAPGSLSVSVNFTHAAVSRSKVGRWLS